ncbi:MAG: hypothetical protein P4M05_21550 [Bradyrhizobium sp.]|nr:hypothetical protein [Bradyrhizobium sp.]
MAPEFGEQFDHLPLIPEHVLRKHSIHQPLDTRFRAAARLLQSIWRTDKQLPAGSYIGPDGKPAKLGSRISVKAGQAGANFVTPEIAALALREVCYREIGAMIDEERLLTNLLSSMPLVFNLFAPLRFDLKLATAIVRQVVRDFIGEVTQVLFEHAPARGNPKFTGDYTAFDVCIRYKTDNGHRGFIAIEVKYSESCQEPVPTPRPRYDDLSRETGLFIDPDSPYLRTNPLQQLWREHCLAQTMVANELYDEGYFLLIAPQFNHLVQAAAGAYRCQLNEPSERQVPFINVTLEDFISAMRQAGAKDHAAALFRRYADFWLVDGEIELALSALTQKRTPRVLDSTKGKRGAPKAEAPLQPTAEQSPKRRLVKGAEHSPTV